MLFLSREDLFADNHSFDFIHKKIREGERHISPAFENLALFFKIAVASNRFRRQNLSRRQTSSKGIIYFKSFKAVKREQENFECMFKC